MDSEPRFAGKLKARGAEFSEFSVVLNIRLVRRYPAARIDAISLRHRSAASLSESRADLMGVMSPVEGGAIMKTVPKTAPVGVE